MTAREPCLSVRNLSKTFPGMCALRDLSLDILPGEIHALVGQNGSGKSTLIKCLSGYQSPDPGATILVGGVEASISSADMAADLGMAFVHQDLGIVPSLTVLENFCLGRGFAVGPLKNIRWRMEADRVRELMAGFGHEMDPRTPVRNLPTGTRTIIAIVRAVAALEEAAHLLVLDEPTAALPEVEVTRLFEIIRKTAERGIGVLYVSHRLREILELADRVSVLRDGLLVGTYPVAGLTEADLTELITGRKLDDYYPAAERTISDEVLLKVRNLCGRRVRDVSFDLRRGEVVGVAGLLGSGCTELGRLLFGAAERSGGAVFFKGRAVNYRDPAAAIKDGIGMISEDRRIDGSFPMATMRENITITDVKRFWKRGKIDRKAERREAVKLMERFSIRPTIPDYRFSQFSGGNQQKGVIAKWTRLGPELLICDEPVVGVDVGAKRDLYVALEEVSKAGAAILLISSEYRDLASLCDRVLIIRNGELEAELKGKDLTEEQIVRFVYGRAKGGEEP